MRTALNFISAFVVAVCIVVAIVFIILYATGTVHYVLDPLNDFVEGAEFGPLVGLSSDPSPLPATWTPRVTFVPSAVPSETSQVQDEVTVVVSQSPPPEASATLLPTETPLSANPSETFPTAEPLYVLQDLLGGPDCDYVGFSGSVWNADGSGREGVRVELFNDAEYKRSDLTDQNGLYEIIIDSKPQPHLEGNWHIRVLENKLQVSNEIIVVMSPDCKEDDLTRFVANFKRTQ